MASQMTATQFLRDPIVNRGSSLTSEIREQNGLAGFIPAGVRSKDVQERCAMKQLRAKPSPMEKYAFLQNLQNVDEALFFSLLCKHTEECMPIVYTPTVGEACQKWSELYIGAPRGLYLSVNDRGHIADILRAYCRDHPKAKVIVVTDGERILGLGDLGVNGMGIPIGKLSLYTACAGIDPSTCLPVQLDVGTNTQSILDDEFYVGLKQKRLRGDEYYTLVEEFVLACQEVFGRQVLVQFEDFGNETAFHVLERWQPNATCFNDDIQGTASVCLAGILASERITGRKLEDNKFVFLGAGEAGAGIAELIAMAISKETGLTIEEARSHIYLIDSKGLVLKDRLNDTDRPLAHHKIPFAHDVSRPPDNTGDKLLDAVIALKPTAIVGVSAVPQTFTQAICQKMSESHEKPLIFALSNPTSKAECTAEQAYTWTNGNCVYASGSPFDPVTLPDGRIFVPGQGNNSYVFPGIGLAAVATAANRLDDDDMYIAAKKLASLVPQDRLDAGCLYPSLDHIREVSAQVASAVAENIFRRGDASVPQPDDLLALCKAHMWDPQARL